MQTFIACLSLLSLLSSVGLVQGTFFSSLKDLAGGKSEGKAASQGNRKVVLVPRTVYVPVYTSDDGSQMTEIDARQPLTPISPIVMGSAGLAPPPRQFSAGDFAAIYAAQPPPSTYAMYGPPSQQQVVEDQSAQAFPYYPPGYGAVGPEFQYAAAPFDMVNILELNRNFLKPNFHPFFVYTVGHDATVPSSSRRCQPTGGHLLSGRE